VFLALSVKENGTVLRSGCSSDSDVIATLPEGATLTIRFAMSGESVPCYKVATEAGGKAVSGYLTAASIEGLETFSNQRKNANWIEVSTTPAAAPGSLANTPALAGAPTEINSGAAAPLHGIKLKGLRVILDAQHLIEQGQPGEAARMLEPQLRAHPQDSGIWGIAGIAAWKNQDNRTALEYWRKSLDLQPNAELQNLYAKVEREVLNDTSNETLYGVRVVLRYDGVVVSAETARRMVALVDDTYARVSAELGCTTKERIPTIVQSREAYFKTTGAAEWSGGLFDGRIHMPADAGQQLDPNLQKVLTHETVHACLAMLGQWPSWLQEGMAQKLSGEVQSPEAAAKLRQLAKDGKIPRLGMLSGGWMGLDSHNAAMAYAFALAAVDTLYESSHSDGVRNLLRNPERLPSITAELDQRLSE
jgi:hypothetical protein